MAKSQEKYRRRGGIRSRREKWGKKYTKEGRRAKKRRETGQEKRRKVSVGGNELDEVGISY